MSEASHAVPAVQMYDPRTVTVPAEAFKKLSGKFSIIFRLAGTNAPHDQADVVQSADTIHTKLLQHI